MTRADIEQDVPGHVEDLYAQVTVLADRQVDHGHKLDALKATQDSLRTTQIEHGARLVHIERTQSDHTAMLTEILHRLPEPTQ